MPKCYLTRLSPVAAGLAALADELRVIDLIGAAVEVDYDVDRALPADVATAVLQIAREATTNVIRHVGLPRVRLSARREPLANVVEVCNHGRGFDTVAPAPRGGSIGWMLSLSRAIGANLSVESAPGDGTTVRIEVPI